MKRLKIRGKEIKRIGYKDDRIISIAINITTNNFKRNQKLEVLEILEKIINNPHDYLDDKIFKSIAEKLIEKPKIKTSSNKIRIDKNKPVHYKIYGRQYIDHDTIQQMDIAMKLPISVKGALMADAHVGYGLPIGGVLATYNSIVPYAVGMDIGCRMCMSVYNLSEEFLEKNRNKLKEILIENTRFGRAEFNDISEHSILESKEFNNITFLKNLKDKAFQQLGTSGGGNHFVDIGIIEIDILNAILNIPKGIHLAILSHSGSRGFGAEIARYYTQIAKLKRDMPKGSINLAWFNLDEEEGIEYWHAMNLAGEYSSANHKIIHQKLSNALGEKPIKIIENHHNFAWKEKIGINKNLIIHRKGATPTEKGKLGIIPGSMATPGYIVLGKGNEESLNSASHGAGRILSRSKAKKTITKKELNQILKKSNIDLIGGNTDEAPEAYKDINKIMEYQKDLVEIIGIFHPKIVRMSGGD